MITREQLLHWLGPAAPAAAWRDEIRRGPAMPLMRDALHRAAPDLPAIPQTTYTLYREFERSGERDTYQQPYFAKRSLLTRAVLDLIAGDDGARDAVHDLLWSICEETTWVLPAHEEQGPDYWELRPSPRTESYGAHTLLTREPDSIDLFAAETGASLAETVFLFEDRLAPEVCRRVRQEVERHIFKPYLAHGRRHWWHQGALNWNGVCNGSIGLAFMRLERDPALLAEALAIALAGFEAYIATGFEPDGGSIEGTGYWNYGLMYYVALAELLRERTGGRVDLLAAPRLRDIARYPLVTALSHGKYAPFGDATEETALEPGIVQRLSERTGVHDLRGLLVSPLRLEGRGVSAAKLAIILRDAAWWDGTLPGFPPAASADWCLPDCGIVKLAGQGPAGMPVALVATAGHNDGHHSHADVGSFVVHVAGEGLVCDPGRGRYTREYFRQARYDNVFCNSFGHGVPRIGGALQSPGPEFGGRRQFHGRIVEDGLANGPGAEKYAVIEFAGAYALPALASARRRLSLAPGTGEVLLEDVFAFHGAPLDVEEALMTWAGVELDGGAARLRGQRAQVELQVLEPAGAVFRVEFLDEACRANHRDGVLARLAVSLPAGAARFRLRITPRALDGGAA